jgi:hypothetical protein
MQQALKKPDTHNWTERIADRGSAELLEEK